MKLVSYTTKKKDRLGLFVDGKVYNLQECAAGLGLELPNRMRRFLRGGDEYMNIARQVEQAIKEVKISSFIDDPNLKLLAPVPNPTSCRDGYAFRQHVQTARRNRGVEMIPEFDQYPVFYFTNHNAIFGEGEIRVEDDHLRQLDFELEAAIVIGKEGRNIEAKEADSFIAGYLIMNDLSARVLQMEEMKLNLGPAKGKDFATSIGPWLVTPDELESYKIPTEFGNKYDLRMTAKHNGKGDSGVARLYKDGIGSAYRTAKAAARTAVHHGVSAADFRAHFLPTCRTIDFDNMLGRIVFASSALVQRWPFSRRAMLRMTPQEQRKTEGPRRMSGVLWDVFTGNAPYRDVFLRSMHPAFVGALMWNVAAAVSTVTSRAAR